MTLLIGIVGNDGWIISADRRQREVAPDVAISSATNKLHSSPEIVFASAGDDLARRMGDEIINLNSQGKLPLGRGRHEELRLFLKAFASKMWRREARDSRGTYPPAINERGLLLGFRSFPNGILVLMIGRHSDAYWIRGGAKTFGDTGNAAKYFLGRFFELYRSDQNKLVFLAAHVISEASKLNPTGVNDGFDIALCRRTNAQEWQIEILEEAALAELSMRSGALDKQTEAAMLKA